MRSDEQSRPNRRTTWIGKHHPILPPSPKELPAIEESLRTYHLFMARHMRKVVLTVARNSSNMCS